MADEHGRTVEEAARRLERAETRQALWHDLAQACQEVRQQTGIAVRFAHNE